MVRAEQSCAFCNYEAESFSSQEYFCGCGQRFCGIDCLIDHGDEAHTNGDITSWPEGTDSRLFESGEIERRWRQQHDESSSDESNMDSSDSESESELHDNDCEEDNNVYCECGNIVGYLMDGEFRTDADCYAYEYDQDGTRWCSDCWASDRVHDEECDELDEEENETEPIVRCECCYKRLDVDGFTNNKGSFCSNVCLQLWTGCPYICREITAEASQHRYVARRLDFDAVAENAANDFSNISILV